MAGIKASRIAQTNETAKIRLDFGEDGDLNLEFDPRKLTVGAVKEMSAAGREQDYGRLAEIFFDILTDWDLLDDDGEKMPYTEEAINALGFVTFINIVAEMGKLYDQMQATSTS